MSGRARRSAIDFHTYSELVLWPYGYTTANTAPGMAADDEAALRTLGVSMASTNGYTPEQASDLYIADGAIDDCSGASTRSSPTPSRCIRRPPIRGSIHPTR
jgi:hypothetical protein